MDNRQTILVVGLVILAMAVVGGVMAAADAPEEAYGIFVVPFFLTFANPLFWIILVIVLAARRRGQQQQQQVVVVTGPPPGTSQGGPRLRCPKCQGLSKADARFCGGCGVRFG